MLVEEEKPKRPKSAQAAAYEAEGLAEEATRSRQEVRPVQINEEIKREDDEEEEKEKA